MVLANPCGINLVIVITLEIGLGLFNFFFKMFFFIFYNIWNIKIESFVTYSTFCMDCNILIGLEMWTKLIILCGLS